MYGLVGRLLGMFIFLGVIGTGFGCYECMQGHNYHVAAEHESTVVGHIVYVPAKGAYKYEFSINGVKMSDSSQICATPLEPGACSHYGPVLVYYSYQPYPNSLLEDFGAASSFAYKVGKFFFAIGLPLFVLPSAGIAFLARKSRRGDNDKSGTIHIVPEE